MSDSEHITAHPTHGHEGHAHAPTGAALFPDAEWQAFHADDKKAGAAIVVLVSSIFAIGVFLYLFVLYTVS